MSVFVCVCVCAGVCVGVWAAGISVMHVYVGISVVNSSLPSYN